MSSTIFGVEGASKPTISLFALLHITCDGCVANPRYPITKLLLLLASCLAKLKVNYRAAHVSTSSSVHTIRQPVLILKAYPRYRI